MAFSVERFKTYRWWFTWVFFSSLLLVAFFDLPEFLAALSVLTLCITIIGFVVTTVITRRKERRGSVQANIELGKKESELEKLRGEIGDRNAAAQKKKKPTKRRRVV